MSKKVMFSKSGTKGETARVGLRVKELSKLGITRETPGIEIKYLKGCVMILKQKAV